MRSLLPFSITQTLRNILILLLLSTCSMSGAENITTLQLLLGNAALLKTLSDIEHKNSRQIDTPLPVAEFTGIASGEELLLSLYVGKYYIADLYAYKNDKNAQLGLSSFFELLDFPITIDGDKKDARGWFINEQNNFYFNWSTAQPSITINGKTTSLDPTQFRIENEDVYVDASTLENWFSIQMLFNFTDLKVQISSNEPLPLEQRLQREQQKRYAQAPQPPVLPWKASHYQMISAPLIDIQLNAAANNNTQYGSYSMLMSHDLAYLNSQLFVSGNNSDNLSDLRLTFSKEDNKAELLGFLKASQYQFGDISPVKTAIGDTGSLARGMQITNQNSANISNNRSTTFSGNIQPGWDIELYRNGLLIAREVSLQNGRYDFNDIDLLFGDNQFELIFYGPQGQVKTEQQQIYIDSNALKAKQSSYAFSTVEVDTPLFNISEKQSNNQPGWLSTGIFEQGITDWFSLHAGVEYLLADEGENQQNYSLGSNLTLFNRLLLGVDLQQDQHSHQKMLFSARSQLGNHSFNLSYEQADKVHWRLPDSVTQTDDLEASMVGSLFKSSFLPINYQNYWRQRHHNQQSQEDELSNQVAFYTPLAAVTHEITWRNYKNEQLETEHVSGFLRLQRNFGRFYSRLQGLYTVKPEQQLTQVKGEFSYPLTLHMQSQLDVDYYPDTEHYRAQVGLNWQYDAFSINTTLSYNSDDIWSAGLFTRFSFGYEPINQQYFASRRTLANSGALMVRVYEDKNLNNQFDEDEPVLEGAKIKGLQNHIQATTNEQGVAILHSLNHLQTSDFILDKDSLEDPFLIPATAGVSMTPRKGFIELLEFPVVMSSELEGTVYLKDKQGNETPGAYIKILLHDKNGLLVNSTESEFDGYYLFTGLLPGQYKASIEVAYSKKKKLKQADDIEVSLQGDVVNGADFILTQLDFIKGYTVTLGSFHSLSMLKTYWQIIKNNYNNALSQQVFYIHNSDTQLYDLQAAFFKNKQQALRACEYLQTKKITCFVNPLEFDITPQ